MVIRYLLRERVYIYNTYVKSKKSCATTRRKFKHKFPDRSVPSRKTIERLFHRLHETGSLNDRKRIQKRRVLTEEKIDEIGAALERNPHQCLRILAQETGISKASAGVATKLLGLKRTASSVSRNMPSLLHDINVPTKKATFAMGCFWAPDSLFGVQKGVIRTRVGFAGGTTENPRYRSIGDHTEAIEIDYDPNEISYDQLLTMFWNHHDPTARVSKQYTSLILYHDQEQKALAEGTLKEEEKKKSSYIVTKVMQAQEFYDAEDYHQKYRLQQHPSLLKALGLEAGPKLKSSHLAARLNGYVVGFGGVGQFDAEVSRLGLDDKTAAYVRKLVVKYEDPI
ncbi:peptide methionine sulfoxide reductase-like isoform X2 [Periplaneta americana]|uniref:peptide methionine sulfoxide reductase-like isoform X2 n=1 Tax=Periplaneta americana TaxID=6978 RepID=UPI0037E89D4C